MCGIVGVSYVNTEEKSFAGPAVGMLRSLMVENTSRGKDSTGLLYVSEDDWEVFHGLNPGKDVQNFVIPEKNTKGVLGHVRYATVGNKKEFANVHPFITKKFVGMHNGTIFNHKLLKSHYELETIGECDSEIAFRLMDKLGLKALSLFEGLFSLAFIRRQNPQLINVVTNGSKPMTFIKVKDQFVAFGSIAEDTLEAMEATYKKMKVEYEVEAIRPCMLYHLKHGKIQRRVDCSGFINYISEAEGELRYKVDYKILKRDLYQMALPLHRRIGPIKEEVVKATTVAKTNVTPAQPKLFENAWNAQAPDSYVGADPKLRQWFIQTSNNLIRQFNKRCITGRETQQYAYFNMDSLGTMINFRESSLMQKFMHRTLFNEDPGTLLFDKEAINPTVSVFSSEEYPTNAWLPTIGQMYTFLTSLMMSDKVYIYSPYRTFDGHPPKPAEIIAGSMCGVLHRQALINITKFIDEALIKTGIVHDELLLLNNTETKSKFTTDIKGHNAFGYSKINAFGSIFSFGKVSELKPYTWATLGTAIKDIYGGGPVKMEDFGVMSRGMFLPLVMQAMLEAYMFDDTKKHVFKRDGNLYGQDIQTLIESLFEFGPEDIMDFFARVRNLKKPTFCKGVRHDCEAFEFSFKQAFRTIFGNTSCFEHGFTTDIYWHLNRMRHGNTIENGAILTINRALVIRDFLVNKTNPDATNKYTIKEPK